MFGNQLIREARRRAGITQRELAERAGTTQSAIARWEAGGTSPDLDTVRRLVRCCGLDLEVALVEWDESDRAQAAALLALDPAERLQRGLVAARRMAALREAGRAG